MDLRRAGLLTISSLLLPSFNLCLANPIQQLQGRQRININDGWKFKRWETNPDGVIYDHRTDLENLTDVEVLKSWILPSANDFIKNPEDRYERPIDEPTSMIPYAETSFDDSAWESVNLPHDWAIAGPFYTDPDFPYYSMGRLPSEGVGWYRRIINLDEVDLQKSIYVELEGAMSYAMVWINGRLVGGWPYGYNSFQLDITEELKMGENMVAIRLDNPQDSSRWYPGGGLYRDVFLVMTNPVHVANYGTYVTTRSISSEASTVDIQVNVRSLRDATVEMVIEIYELEATHRKKCSENPRTKLSVAAGESQTVNSTIHISNPRLWGPVPLQTPNMYVAVTRLYVGGEVVDRYETQFGIRSITYDGQKGLLVNGEHVPVYGTNNHHDLGALGAAFNVRAAQRQLEILQEMGCNSLRMAHDPPAPQLLELANRMGFLVQDEIFDTWRFNKTDNDFHLIFPEWHEADVRNFIRRDRNHPSIIAWSYGNEVHEQLTNKTGAALSTRLNHIFDEEDPGRQTTSSIASVTPEWPFPHTLDIISLNYLGAGVRDLPTYVNVSGDPVPPIYADYHAALPEKLIWSTESASTLSTRGTYFFPVTGDLGALVNESSGGDEASMVVSDWGLYTATYGQSPDRSFLELDKHPYVAGEFVWTGFDCLGEPTPYDTARSAYSGIIDLAGFRKDRFYQYQSRWRPDFPMAHILPHWNWPERVGLETPVHVFSSADEAELFLNGESQGRVTKGQHSYRFRWDHVIYEAGELEVVTYKAGVVWASAKRRTTGEATGLRMTADRDAIASDGVDLSFLTIDIVDDRGDTIPQANYSVTVEVSGPGEVLGTDNGYPADFDPFPSNTRNAFNGLVLAIVKARRGSTGPIEIRATADGLSDATVVLNA